MEVIKTDKLQNELPSFLTKPVICYCRKVDPPGICTTVKFMST